jgi:signal transduction histidine kinase
LSVRLTDIDLNALGNEIVDELAVRAPDSGVRVVLAFEHTRLHSDPDLLRRVLANLVENALRHAPEGSEVGLTSELIAPELDPRDRLERRGDDPRRGQARRGGLLSILDQAGEERRTGEHPGTNPARARRRRHAALSGFLIQD